VLTTGEVMTCVSAATVFAATVFAATADVLIGEGM
jgi:hypothetical protein